MVPSAVEFSHKRLTAVTTCQTKWELAWRVGRGGYYNNSYAQNYLPFSLYMSIIEWALFSKALNSLPLAKPQLWWYLGRSHTKFEVAEVMDA